MESLNLKIIPLAIIAVVLSYLSFSHATYLVKEVEIMFDLTQILQFLILLAVYLSLTGLTISLIFALTKNVYFRMGLFFLILLPYASVFILSFVVDPIVALAFLALFLGMSATIFFEFDRFYGNQIKARLDIPARANTRTVTFFLALTAAITFFSVNSDPTVQQDLTDRIINNVTTATTEAIQDYGLVDQIIGSQMGNLGRAVPTEVILPQLNEYITNQIEAIISPYRPYIVYILTALVFATITGVTTFTGIISTLLSYVAISLLKSAGYIRETKEMVEVTRFTV